MVIVVLIAVLALLASIFKMEPGSFALHALFALHIFVAGTIASGIVIGLYIYLSHFIGHTFENEVIMCQSNEDYKNFLRLHITKQGELHIYPVGVDKVGKKWTYQGTNNTPKFTLENDDIKSLAHLIEEPVVIAKPEVREKGA